MKWKLSSVGQALVVSSGLVFLNERKPKGIVLSEILQMIRKNPSKSYYTKVIPRRITLGEALEYEGFEKLGQVRDTYSSIDLYLLQPEREFDKLPKTGGELLNNHYQSKARKL